jgi:small-conductance mechanosensitive channel
MKLRNDRAGGAAVDLVGPRPGNGPFRVLLWWLLGSGVFPCFVRGASEESPSSRDDVAYKRIERLNARLPRLNDPPDLETPQPSIESFIDSCRKGDYDRAARSLNLDALPAERQAVRGRELARQLKAVMDQQVWFKWSEVPDRPDGQLDEEDSAAGGQPSAAGGARSRFLLYTLFIGDRDYAIQLECVKPRDGPPVWVFSRQTVEHIPTLYAQFHPSRLETRLPSWMREYRFAKVAVWQWAGFLVLSLAGLALGWLVWKVLELATRWTGWAWLSTLSEALRGPGVLTIGLFTFYLLATRYLGLAGPIVGVLRPLYVTILVLCIVRFLQRVIHLGANRFSRRFEDRNSDEGNVLITRLAVARHLLTFLVVIGGVVYALSGYSWARRFGTSLLASAGFAGIILGLAAQRVLGNLFSGILLAVVQPVKAGDAVIFEGDFGWIEEINITYLVIHTWDRRRLIVPISHFMDKPFQNWSRGSQQIIKPVEIQADYRLDVDAVRGELKTILEGTDLWDESVPPILQVTESREGSIVMRALCSGKDPAGAWDLHCLVRERLIEFIRNLEGGRYLPRRRLVLFEGVDRDGPTADDGQATGATSHAGR